MVAAHSHGAVIDESHHRLDRPFRIGAISDIVAEADHPFRATRPRCLEAGAERLPVGMDIGKDSETHVSSAPMIAHALAGGLTDIKQQAARSLQSCEMRGVAATWRNGSPLRSDDRMRARTPSAYAALPGP
jgi:hypothetical protein